MSCGTSSDAPEFLCIAGATGAGKTALSLPVARELDAEIISMDSRQIYRGMDIGTDKAAPHERAGVPHHGLDIRSPGERYSAGAFARDARRWIAGIRARGRVPLLVGGTGFFLRALTEPLFAEPPLEPARRAAAEAALEALSGAELERWVRVLDPERAGVAVQGGRQRMIRTLLVALLTGRSLSWWHRRPRAGESAPAGVMCVVEVPREVLDARIARRIREMVAAGFAGEVAGLMADGWTRADPGMDGVGYREMADHLEGRITLEDAVERTRLATRQYARRQVTWFRHQLGPGTVRVDGTAPLEAQCTRVVRAWRERTASSPDAPARGCSGDPFHGPADAP